MAGRILDADIDEVRNRADLGEIAAEYMQLRRAGGGRLKALCPFHTEKTPSFTIDPAKGLFHCFGCSKGGNVYTLVMELENMSFVEAVERLANRVGVTLRYENVSPAEREAAGKRGRMIAAHREAVGFYQDALMRSDEGKAGRDYLKARGFTKQTAETFRIGWSPKAPRDALTRLLRAKGFPEALLVEAGLARRGQEGVTDAFRGRLMFPIHDLAGDPVAFGARMLEGSGPKYLNTAESPVWHKGRVLYAMHLAKAAAVKEGRTVIVEGYTDVIALHQAGVRVAVASCGTALGLDHFKLVRRFTDRAILAYDADQAGQAAATRAFEEAFSFSQEAGIDTRVVELPAGQDPADFVLGAGPDAAASFAGLVEQAVPIVEYRLTRELARFDVVDPESRERALRATLPILRQARDTVIRLEYARWLAGRLRVDEDLVVLGSDPGVAQGEVSRATLKRASAQVKVEREALKLALQFPAVVKPYGDRVSEEDFSVRAHQAIWHEVRHGDFDASALLDRLPDANARKAVSALTVEDVLGEVSDRLVEEIFARLKEFSLARQIDERKNRLQKLNPVKQPDEYAALFAELIGLEGRRREARSWGNGAE